MKRFFNILYFVSLSMLALGQNTQGDSFFFMDAGVNEIIVNTRQEPKIDTVVVIQRDTSVVYEYQEIANKDDAQSPTTILVRNTAYEQRLLGVEKYSYGEIQMDEKAFQKFLYENNTKIYVDYMKSKRLISAGWWTMGAGISMLGLGVGLMFVEKYIYDSFYDRYYYDWNYEAYQAGISFITFGAAAIVASVPIVSVGYTKEKKVAYSLNNDLYIADNNSAISKPAMNLSLQASQNGIGLALNF